MQPEPQSELNRELSPRMAEALHLVCSGKTRKQIAIEMKISQSTLRSYIYRAFDRLNVKTIPEACVKITKLQMSTYKQTTGE